MPWGIFKKKPIPPEVQEAYDLAYQKARIERAKRLGREAGSKGPTRTIDRLTKLGDNVLASGFFGNTPKPKKKRR